MKPCTLPATRGHPAPSLRRNFNPCVFLRALPPSVPAGACCPVPCFCQHDRLPERAHPTRRTLPVLGGMPSALILRPPAQPACLCLCSAFIHPPPCMSPPIDPPQSGAAPPLLSFSCPPPYLAPPLLLGPGSSGGGHICIWRGPLVASPPLEGPPAPFISAGARSVSLLPPAAPPPVFLPVHACRPPR